VGRREHDAEWISTISRGMGRRKHHRDPRARQFGKHLRVPGKIISTREQRGLVDRRGNDALNYALFCKLNCALDRSPA